MKPARFAILVLFLLALLMPAVRASTQEPQSAPQRPPARAPATEPAQATAAEVQVLFDAMVVVQAQKALGLTDTQYPQFVGRLKALQDTRRRNQRARNQIIQEIARLTSPNNAAPDESQLRDKLKALDDLESKTAAEIRKAYENLDQVLDIRQRARFRVFEEQVERRKFQFLLNTRRGRTQAMKRPAAR
jgi:uncharacterized membrane protein YdfJ with MMPL/SSD domain